MCGVNYINPSYISSIVKKGEESVRRGRPLWALLVYNGGGVYRTPHKYVCFNKKNEHITLLKFTASNECWYIVIKGRRCLTTRKEMRFASVKNDVLGITLEIIAAKGDRAYYI